MNSCFGSHLRGQYRTRHWYKLVDNEKAKQRRQYEYDTVSELLASEELKEKLMRIMISAFPRESRGPFGAPVPNFHEHSIKSVNPRETFPIPDDDAFNKYKKLIAWRIAWTEKKLSPDMRASMMRYLFRMALGIQDEKQEKTKKTTAAKKSKKTKQRANGPFDIYSDPEIPTCLRVKSRQKPKAKSHPKTHKMSLRTKVKRTPEKMNVKRKATERFELLEDSGSEGSTDLDDIESSGEEIIYYSFCHHRWESSRNCRHCPFCCFCGDQRRRHCEACGECQWEEICEYCGGQLTSSWDLGNPDD